MAYRAGLQNQYFIGSNPITLSNHNTENTMKLLLDDIRNPSDVDRDAHNSEWVIARDPFKFHQLLKKHWDELTEVWFDNDLGEDPMGGFYREGRQILTDLECKWEFMNIKPHFKMYAHSANPVARREMEIIIERIESR